MVYHDSVVSSTANLENVLSSQNLFGHVNHTAHTSLLHTNKPRLLILALRTESPTLFYTFPLLSNLTSLVFSHWLSQTQLHQPPLRQSTPLKSIFHTDSIVIL